MSRLRAHIIGGLFAAIAISSLLSIGPAGSGTVPAGNVNLALGNPSGATTGSGDPDNRLVTRPQFALAYSKSQGGPNWVSWHLQRSDLGRTGRTGPFAPDLLLPADSQIRPTDYAGSGFDRGHMCPSGDRTTTKPTNRATFVMSNMLPQTADLNRRVWEGLESYCRTRVRQGNEMYIVAGGHGTKGRIANGKVNVPLHCWKVIVELPQGNNDLGRIDSDTRVIAVDMPNAEGIEDERWQKFIVAVNTVEAATNLDFFSALPTDVQETLERKVDTGRAPARRRRGGGR
jgi:endonuclease G